MKTRYIIYYADKNGESEGYEVYGSKELCEALKWLHSIKATHIEIYKRGKNFASNQDDVLEARRQYWK